MRSQLFRCPMPTVTLLPAALVPRSWHGHGRGCGECVGRRWCPPSLPHVQAPPRLPAGFVPGRPGPLTSAVLSLSSSVLPGVVLTHLWTGAREGGGARAGGCQAAGSRAVTAPPLRPEAAPGWLLSPPLGLVVAALVDQLEGIRPGSHHAFKVCRRPHVAHAGRRLPVALHSGPGAPGCKVGALRAWTSWHACRPHHVPAGALPVAACAHDLPGTRGAAAPHAPAPRPPPPAAAAPHPPAPAASSAPPAAPPRRGPAARGGPRGRPTGAPGAPRPSGFAACPAYRRLHGVHGWVGGCQGGK